MPYKDPQSTAAKASRKGINARAAAKRRGGPPTVLKKHKDGAARSRSWYDANRHKVRAYNFERKYGITVADWEAMLIAQAGRCGICAEPMESPFVDHCHGTSVVRELLCSGCNFGIGSMQDDPGRLRAAADYLERHR